jgi:hypothetical protein
MRANEKAHEPILEMQHNRVRTALTAMWNTLGLSTKKNRSGSEGTLGEVEGGTREESGVTNGSHLFQSKKS